MARKKKAPAAGESAQPPQGLTVEAVLERLESIAKELEGGGADLERSLKLYREARELYGTCLARLGEAEREVRILMANGSVQGQDAEAPPPGEAE